MRLIVGLAAAILAGAWLGVAFEWWLWADEPEHRQAGYAAARGAVWFAVAFAVCEAARRLLRAGWPFVVPVTVLVGVVLYDGVTLLWDGGAFFLVVRLVASWVVSLPVMAAVVVLAHAVTKGTPASGSV